MKSLFCLLISCCAFACFAQNTVSPLQAKWNSVYKDGKKLKKDQYIALLENQNNTLAFQKYSSARDYHTIAWAAFSASLLGAGYELGARALNEKKKKNDMFFVGAGTGLLLGVFFEFVGIQKLKKSVKFYNSSRYEPRTSSLKPLLHYYVAADELKIAIRF
jgi:hypothetical protein